MNQARWCPDRQDIIWIDFNPQLGQEMKDLHPNPMMVLSPKSFNERTGIVIGLPMTTAHYNETNPFALSLQGTRGKTSYILAHQPKSFDWKKRKAKLHPWKKAPDDIFKEACERLNQIVALTEN